MAECSHPIHVGGMCGNCGAILDDLDEENSISMMHDTQNLTVSRQEAQRLDSESTRLLLEQRKLALIVDLDQTIIHATVDPTVGEWLKDPNNPNYEALKGVGSFRLGMDGKAVLEDGTGSSAKNSAGTTTAVNDEGCWYYVKPRPGLTEFLKTLSQKYELHVYTMGTRSYANCVCKLVDPDGTLFGTRILSRDENGSLLHKSLSRLFPMDTSMVVIIDDRGDVWNWSPNLVKVIPYDFFIGSGDINATFLPAVSGPASAVPGGDTPTSQPATSASPSTSQSPSDTTADAEPLAKKDTADSVTERLNDAAEKEQEQDDAAKAKAEQSQKSAVTEQLESRPLAKMQERLDVKLGISSTESAAPSETDGEKPDELPSAEEEASASASKTNGTLASEPSTEPAVPTPSTQSPQQPEPSPQDAEQPAAPNSETAAPSVPAAETRAQAVLKDNDQELDRVGSILEQIHSQWYERWDAQSAERQKSANDPAKGKGRARSGLTASDDTDTGKGHAGKPTVMEIISDLKKEVLRSCDIVFSSLIPMGGPLEDSDYFWIALEYGASCSEKVRAETTHVVAQKWGTAKVNAAHARGNVHIVWPCWLHDSVARWAKQPEARYAIPRTTSGGEVTSSAHPTDDELSSDEMDSTPRDWQDSAPEGAEAGGSQEWWNNEGGGGLAGMDWAEGDKELQEYLNGSEDGDDEDDGEDAVRDSEDGGDSDDGNSIAGYGTDVSESSALRTPKANRIRKGKRSRPTTPSTSGDSPPTTPRKSSGLRQVQSGLYKSIGPPSASPEESDTGGEASQGGADGASGDASGDKLGKRRRSIPVAEQRKNGSGDPPADGVPQAEEDAYNSSSSAKSVTSATAHKKPRHSSKASPSQTAGLSAPRSRSRSRSRGDTGSTLDEGEASLMKDLEDEIEAAMGAADESLDEAGLGDGNSGTLLPKSGIAATASDAEGEAVNGGFDATGVRVD